MDVTTAFFFICLSIMTFAQFYYILFELLCICFKILVGKISKGKYYCTYYVTNKVTPEEEIKNEMANSSEIVDTWQKIDPKIDFIFEHIVKYEAVKAIKNYISTQHKVESSSESSETTGDSDLDKKDDIGLGEIIEEDESGYIDSDEPVYNRFERKRGGIRLQTEVDMSKPDHMEIEIKENKNTDVDIEIKESDIGDVQVKVKENEIKDLEIKKKDSTVKYKEDFNNGKEQKHETWEFEISETKKRSYHSIASKQTIDVHTSNDTNMAVDEKNDPIQNYDYQKSFTSLKKSRTFSQKRKKGYYYDFDQLTNLWERKIALEHSLTNMLKKEDSKEYHRRKKILKQLIKDIAEINK